MPQLLSTLVSTCALQLEKPQQQGAHAPQLEKNHTAKKRPTAKDKQIKKKKKYIYIYIYICMYVSREVS